MCSLDPYKTSDYISQLLDEKIKTIVKIIISMTQYIPFYEMYNQLLDSLVCLKDIKFNIVYDIFSCDKIGSEPWLTSLIWSKIQHNCDRVIDSGSEIDNNHPIVFIDDCIYSGSHILSRIKRIVSTFKEFHQTELFLNTIIIVIPYVSTVGYHMIVSDVEIGNLDIKFAPHCIVPCLTQSKEFMNMFDNIDQCMNYMSEIFGNEWCVFCTIYFDHKVANAFSTFPQIYLEGQIFPTNKTMGSLLKKNPSRPFGNIN
jgi:hypothetical protein